jgi:hypothetical protein
MAYGMIAGGILSAFGSMYAGSSQANSLNAQANLNMQNAAEAKAQAGLNAYSAQVNASAAIGHEAASMGAFGGANATTYAALASSTSNAELNRLNIIHQGDINAIQYENEAALERAGASSASTGGFLGGLGNLMNGITNAYTSTYGTGAQQAQLNATNANTNAINGMNFSSVPNRAPITDMLNDTSPNTQTSSQLLS